jgi:hypothetical protein
MARLKRVIEQQNLTQFDFFVEDTERDSQYFAITELPQTLTGGRNGFLVTGTHELELDTDIKIEIIDVDGNPVYYEIAKGKPQYYEGRSKVISVWVYDDTPIGIGKITILGELRRYRDTAGNLIDIPLVWRGVYNVRWERTIMINSKLANETKVRFKSRPILTVTETIANIKKRIPTTVQITGSLSGSAISPRVGNDWYRFQGETDYRLKLSGATWDELMIPNGGIVEVATVSQGYSTKIKKVLDSSTALAITPYFTTASNNTESSAYTQLVSNFSGESCVISYVSESFESDTANEGTASFARITITDLETFSGDVHRVKLFRRPVGSSIETDYELVQEQIIESKEGLVDNTKIGREFRTGVFRNSNTITEYWNTSSFFVTASLNDTTLFQSIYLTSSANVVEIVSGSTTIPAPYTFPSASSTDFVVTLITYQSRSLAGTDSYTGSVFYESSSVISDVSQSFYVSGSTVVDVPSFIPPNGLDNTIFVLHDVSSSLAGTSPHDGSVYAYSSSLKHDYSLSYKTGSIFTIGSEYNASFFTVGSGEGSLEIYASGSSFYNRSASVNILDVGHGKLIGSVTIGSGGRVDKQFDENFTPDVDGLGVLKFVTRGGVWYINDVSLNEYFETNFSPNRFETVIQSPTTINDETYEFRAEYFDVNSNKIDVVSVSGKQQFYGGNLFGKSINFTANKANFTFIQPDISGSFTRTPSPLAQTIEFTTSNRGLISGSVVYSSQSFDTSGSIIPSASYHATGSYPGRMTGVSDTGSLMTVANFTGSNSDYVVGSVQVTATSEGKSDTVTIIATSDGISARQYFIRPRFGTVLKNKDGGDPNNVGNLEVELVKFVDGGLVSSSIDLGNVKLYSSSVELSTALNGITAGAFVADPRYNARVSGSAITGSLVLSAEDTGSGIVWDTITLADLQDGVPAGYVTANTRVIKRNPNDDTYNINSLGLTASFYIPNQSDGTGTTYNRFVSIDPEWTGTNDQMSWSYDAGGTTDITAVGSDLDGGIVNEDTYSTTTDLSLTFTYTDPIYGNVYSTEETFYIIESGLDGSGSINPLAHSILPLSGTYFSTNPNSGLHQPAWLEFRTQTTTSGSVYDIASGSQSYLRRQRDNLNITASGDNITYRITKDDIDALETFEWYSGSAPTLVDTISVSDITDGTNSVSYLIRPFFGTVLKNKDGGNPSSAGNLEVQLVKISGSQEYIVNSGDIKLYSASVELVGSMNGISAGTATGSPYNGSGVLPYHAQISGSAITGSLTVIAKSGSIVVDTITLADLQDGQPAGYITSNAGRTITRSSSNVYTPTRLGITGSFYIPNQSDGTGTTYNRYVGIDPNWSTVDQLSWSYESGGSTDIVVTANDVDGSSVSAGSYSNTKDLSVTFTYTDSTYGTTITTEETFHIVSDGTDGIPAPSGILNLDDNNRVWLYNPNSTTYVPTDITNGITASFYIGGTVTATRGFPISISGQTFQTGSEDITLRTDDWANVSIDVDGGDTNSLVIAFTSSSITIREQFNIVTEGLDGTGSINPLAHSILPLSGTFFSTNPNSGLSQPAWLEFKTQTTTSGSVYDIASGSQSYLRKQSDNTNITASVDNVTYRITKDDIDSLETFEWYSGSVPSVVDTISVSDITDGTNSVSYFIRPFFGTVLKNKDGGDPSNAGNLEVQLVKISGSQEYILNSGDVKLYSASVELVGSMNGISAGTATSSPYNGSGVIAYHAQISGSAITGSLTIIAKSGSVVADTITLSDLQDGKPAGYISTNSGRTLIRSGSNIYTPSSLGVTGSFYIPNQSNGTGTTYSRYVGILPNWTTVDQLSWSYESGGSTDIVVTANDVDGTSVSEASFANTKDLSVTFTYTDSIYGTTITTEETFHVVSDGTDGIPAPSGILNLDDNNRVWLYNPNTGVYTPTDVTNGITASFYIGGTLTATRGWPITISGTNLQTGSEDTGLRTDDWTNVSIDVDGGGTSNMTIAFTSASITLKEQFNIVSEPRTTFGLIFSPENKVVNVGPTGAVITGLPDTINARLYVDGTLETDYTTWTWISSSANLTVAHSADRKSFTISAFTPDSLEQAITSVTASKTYNDYSTTLQGEFIVSKAYQGRQGPGVVYIGAYDDLAQAWPLQNDDVRRDIVSHASTYYYYTGSDGDLKSAISADNGHPTGSNTLTYWGTFTNFAAVATDILLAQDAYIGKTLNVGTDKISGEANITLSGGTTLPYISLGQSTQNYGENGFFLGSGSVSGTSAKMSIVGSSGFLTWDGSNLGIKGTVTITGGNSALTSSISGAFADESVGLLASSSAASTSASWANTSASWNSDSASWAIASASWNATSSSRAYASSSANSASIYTSNAGFIYKTATPAGTGLFLSADKMGFYGNSVWTTYMDNTGNLYLNGTVGSGNGLSWNSTTNILAVSGTIYAISGSIGGVSIFNDSIQATNFSLDSAGNLSVKNANIEGFLSASQGGFLGGFTIGDTALESANSRIVIDGLNESISVKDSSNTSRFLVNTETTLPDPTASDSITENSVAATTDTNTWSTTGISSATYTHDTVAYSLPPALTGTYTFTSTLGTHASRKVYSGNSVFEGSAQASVSVKLQILDGSNNVIAESGAKRIIVDSSENGWNVTTSWPSTTFSVDADLTASGTYKARWHVTETGGWFGSKPPSLFDPVSTFYINSEAVDGVLELAKTTINGGGFQSVISTSKWLRVRDSDPTVLISGSFSVSGSVDIADIIYADTGSFNRSVVGTGHLGSLVNIPNQLVAKGLITSEQAINIIPYDQSNVEAARFVLEQSEASNTQFGMMFGIVSGSGVANKKVYIAPVVDSSAVFSSEIYYDMTNTRWVIAPALHVAGALSKTSGTFIINHPDPEKNKTHDLLHSFVESPTAGDNIYRYEVEVIDGSGWTFIPDYFKHLNTDIQIWVNPVKHFGRAWGEITKLQNAVKVFADTDGLYNVLIIGTRNDVDATEAWKGVERLKNVD